MNSDLEHLVNIRNLLSEAFDNEFRIEEFKYSHRLYYDGNLLLALMLDSGKFRLWWSPKQEIISMIKAYILINGLPIHSWSIHNEPT